MAIALGESLLHHDQLDEQDLMERFCDWAENGNYSCTASCFDIGVTVRQALSRYRQTGNAIAGPTSEHAAGNGSLMRLAPVAVLFWNDGERRDDAARRQSRTTHGASEAVEACVAYANLIAEGITGLSKDEIFTPRGGAWPTNVAAAMRMEPLALTREQVRSGGYVIESLEAALWAVGHATGFEDAVIRAVNLGGDADTTGAIAGQLAGAIHGAASLPQSWLAKLAWRNRIEALADQLFDRSVAGKHSH